MSGACASNVSRCTGTPPVVSTWSVGGWAVNRTVRFPARTGLNVVRRSARADALGCVRLRQPAIVWHRGWRPGDDWQDADADRGRAERRHDDLDGPAADRDVGRLPADDAAREARRQRRRP